MTVRLRRALGFGPVDQLTSREQEVLALIAAGKTNIEIAQTMGITFYTARNHVSNVLGKLEADSREEAAAWWLDHASERMERRRSGLPGALVFFLFLAAATFGAVWLIGDGSGRPIPAGPGPAETPAAAAPLPGGLLLLPDGSEEVARLSPIRITFERPPNEREGAAIVQFDPPIAGDYAWIDARTLHFQPEFPGLVRGATYSMHIAAQPEAGLTESVTRTFTVEGKLTVQTVIPADGDVEVPAAAQILVQFNRSVAPLTILSEQPEGEVLVIDPPLGGRGEWLNTSLYRFIPDALAPNTTYRVTVPAGLSSAADGVLEADYTWSFTSFGPAIDLVTPPANSRFAAPSQQVTAIFNQPMDRASVEAGFRLLGPNGAAVPGTFTWTAGDTRVVFSPATPLDPMTSYRVEIDEGRAGAAGGTTDSAWSSTFITVGPPTILSTTPANGLQDAYHYGIDLRFSNPMDTESFEGRITITPAPEVDPFLYAYEEDRGLSISVPLQASTSYTVVIAAGATDIFGQPMGAHTFSFRTRQLDAFVAYAVPGQVTTYSSTAEPTLYFHATNRSSATFTLYPLTDSEAAHMWRTNSIGPTLPPTYRFNPSQPPLRTWTESWQVAQDEVTLRSTSLSGGGPLPKGSYYVRTSDDYYGQLAFTVVDTVLVTKVSHDELLVWAVDHDTGEPVAGLDVRARGLPYYSNTPLNPIDETRATGADGLVSFPLRDATERAEPGPQDEFLVTTAGSGRLGIAHSAWQQGASTWELGLPIEYAPYRYVAHVYSDRPIYRPGEEVHFKGVVRVDDDARYSVPEEAPPIDAVVYDATGRELLRQAVTLNEYGSVAGALVLPADAAIGNYHIQLEWRVRPDWRIGIAAWTFLVAEFRVPEFEVAVTAPEASYGDGDTIQAEVEASFFFGGAVEGAPVGWTVLSSPHFPTVEGYEQFSFTDFDDYTVFTAADPVRASGSTTTDAQGRASIPVTATILGEEGPQEYTIAATVTDQNAQAVASSTTVAVFPAGLLAGIRPAHYIASEGQPSRFDIVLVDLDGAPLAGRDAAVRVYQRTWITTKEQGPDGSRRYRSEPVDELVETLAVTTDGSGEASVEVTPEQGGSLRIVVEAADGEGRLARGATFLWVYGGAFASWQVTNNDLIELVADREAYEVGDTAEILVPAPFEGSIGLVTVERGTIITREVLTFETNAEVLRVPITERSVPNVFVSVVLYRPPTTEDPVPRYKVGYVELPVSTETRELVVSIEPDTTQAQPGETVTYDIRVTDTAGRPVQAELSVAVVDKAVLSLAEERGPDGLAAFWFERGLGVRTGSSLAVSIDRSNDVISEPRLGGKGGGGSDDDRLRQDFRNTAYWTAQLETGADGRASVSVSLPDNLTTWRLQARAISGDTMVGEAVNELLSTQPLLLRPALPRFLRVGDELMVRLLVRNATPNAAGVTVSIDAVGIVLLDGAARTITVAAGASVMVEWPARVAAEGTAQITFTALGDNGLTDAVVQELPIYLDVTPETTATGGVAGEFDQLEALYLPEYALLDGGSLDVSVQASLTGSAAGELSHFRRATRREYEGSDEIASRIIATIGVRRGQQSAGLAVSGLDGEIQTDIATLVGRQRGDGGWAWCTLCSESDPFITGWVLVALGEARVEGRPVDANSLDRASTYVFDYVNRLTDTRYPQDPNDTAFMLYALARADSTRATLNTMQALLEQHRAQLTNSGRAYLLLAFNEAGLTRNDASAGILVNDLATSVIASANGNHWEDSGAAGRRYHTDTRTTALVLDALVRIFPEHPLIEETVRWLMVARGATGWERNVDRAQAILSLSEFAVETGELAGDFDFAVLLDEAELLKGHFAPADGARSEQASVALTEITAGEVSLLGFDRDNAAPGRLYYTLNLRYFTPAREVEALNRGIAVSHKYTLLDEPGAPVTTASLGDTVRITVTVVTEADRNYVVVEDFLPAGLEPIDPNLRAVDPALRAQLEAERQEAALGDELPYHAPWFHWYWSPWNQADTRDDRVTLRALQLPRGVHEFIYYARATTPGAFFVGPARAEESFFPEVFGRSDSSTFTVVP